MHRFAFPAIAALVSLSCAAPAPPPALESIRLDLSGPRPTAQLRIGETPPVTAIFDTGAAASVLKLDYAQTLNLPNQGAASAAGPAGAPVQGFRTTIPAATLGDAHFGPAFAVALDIPLPLPGVSAIISPAVFSGRLVRFDFAHSVAEVLARWDSSTPSGEAYDYNGGDNPMSINRVPAVRVTLPGAPVMADIDTGTADGLVLPLSMASGLSFAAPPVRDGALRMVGVDHPKYRATLNGATQIGPLTLHNPPLLLVDGARRPIVGMSVLRGAIVVLDPQNHRDWMLAPSGD